MSSDLTNGNAFYFEYAIIGAHALAWLVVVAVYVLGIPLGDLARINPGLLVILLPFVYVVGLVVDYASHTLLKPLRLLIRRRVLATGDIGQNEAYLALESTSLYAAYEQRTRRIRIVGAAIFNWPLLGAALLLSIGAHDSPQLRAVVIATAICTILSVATWVGMYRDAYKFRQNAVKIIRDRGIR